MGRGRDQPRERLEPEFRIPISGIGGVSNWRDAVEFMLLGSSTVQVCTEVMLRGTPVVLDNVAWDMTIGFAHNDSRVESLGRTDLMKVVAVGRGHEELPYADELGRYGASLAFTQISARDGSSSPDRPVAPGRSGTPGAAVRSSTSRTNSPKDVSAMCSTGTGTLRSTMGSA